MEGKTVSAYSASSRPVQGIFYCGRMKVMPAMGRVIGHQVIAWALAEQVC